MIALEKIQKTYSLAGETFQALDGVSLKIEEGEFVSIIGQSGSGKSTLLNVIGMLDDWDHGEYFLEGENVSKLKSRKVAKLRNEKIGFIYQNFNLLQKMSALENVALPLLYGGKSAKESVDKAKKYLELVGLGDKVHHKPTQLSGGQQQRVAIARALVNEPKILLADEPTGALDSRTSSEIVELIKHIWRQQGVTVILVTHDPAVAAETNRVIHVSDGQIV